MRLRHRQQLGVALFPLGVFLVHELRYQLAFGSDASRMLADRGHGYLHELMPLIALAVALGLGGLLARLARAWRSGKADCANGRGVLGLCALASGGLFSIYVGQEFLEGLLATGHPDGLVGILGDGGLWALPASVAIGCLVALVVGGGRALVAHVARLRRQRPPIALGRAPKLAVRPLCVALPRLAPLAGMSAGRAPPSGAS
jgi:hypothetical protein